MTKSHDHFCAIADNRDRSIHAAVGRGFQAAASRCPGSQLSDFLSLTGPGYKGSTQGMQDWGSRYANDATWGGSDAATPGDLVALRNARMSLPAKMSADPTERGADECSFWSAPLAYRW